VDIRPTIILVGPVITIGIVGVLFGILQFLAPRRGRSLRENLAAGGWVIALEVVFAASMFSGILVNVLMTPYNVPVDWTPILLEGPLLGALGVAAFLMACRGVGRNLPFHPTPASQKG